MANIHVTRRDGRKLSVSAQDGQSVMHALRQDGLDDLQALCGGNCSCATCHVFVSDAWADRLPVLSDTEDGLLDNSEHRAANSRLACQIAMGPALDGLTLTIAPDG